VVDQLKVIAKRFRQYDMNNDGEISEEEILNSRELLELSLKEEKAEVQKRISWVAIISMLLITAFLVLPIIPESRITVLSDLISIFYLAQASIVGFYFGATAYMSRN
jgi:hypothetical protein